jgi:hypothetical protein
MGIACQETFIVIKERPLKEALVWVFHLLEKNNILPALDEYEPILLNDTEQEEFDDDEIYPKSIEEAKDSILNHPTGGIIAFKFGKYILNMGCTCLRDNHLAGLSIWIHDYAYRENTELYDKVIDHLHNGLSSLRTIQGWNMMDYIDGEEDEILRVYSGNFQGEFKLDLRGDKIVKDGRKDGKYFE